MNASEDQTEPLGESPAIGTLDGIKRAAEIGMLSPGDRAAATAQLAERQADALNEIRELATYWREELSRPPHPPARKQAGQSILAILARLGV